MRHVGLLLALEEHFDFRLGDRDAARLTSVRAIRQFLEDGARVETNDSEGGPATRSLIDPLQARVTVAHTAISEIDGDRGEIRYRGYSVVDLARRCSFEETAHCLLYGDLASPSQLQEFSRLLAAARTLPDELLPVLEAFRHEPAEHALVAAIAADVAWEKYRTFEELAIALIAKLPTIIATQAALAVGRSAPVPDPDLGHAANTLFMLRGEAPSEKEAAALDATLITQAEFGFAPSTTAARAAIGVEAGVRPALLSALNILSGARHAGTVAKAMELQASILDADDAQHLAQRWRRGEGRPYGFGHRVFRLRDPRSGVLRDRASTLADELADPKPVQQVDLLVEAVAVEWKGALSPNYDCYSATVYRLLGVESTQATALFTCGRVVGLLSHVAEQLANNHLIHPRLQYTGPGPRDVARGGRE